MPFKQHRQRIRVPALQMLCKCLVGKQLLSKLAQEWRRHGGNWGGNHLGYTSIPEIPDPGGKQAEDKPHYPRTHCLPALASARERKIPADTPDSIIRTDNPPTTVCTQNVKCSPGENQFLHTIEGSVFTFCRP